MATLENCCAICQSGIFTSTKDTAFEFICGNLVELYPRRLGIVFAEMWFYQVFIQWVEHDCMPHFKTSIYIKEVYFKSYMGFYFLPAVICDILCWSRKAPSEIHWRWWLPSDKMSSSSRSRKSFASSKTSWNELTYHLLSSLGALL